MKLNKTKYFPIKLKNKIIIVSSPRMRLDNWRQSYVKKKIS